MHRKAYFALSRWPEAYRHLGTRMDSSARSMCGQFLGFCAARALDPALIDHGMILLWLDGKYPPKRGCSTRRNALSRVFRMLTDAHPGSDFAWIRHLSAIQTGYVRTGAPRGLVRTCSFPPSDWPTQWQQRWSLATGHIFNPAPVNRWQRLRQHNVRHWREIYAAGIEGCLGQWVWTMHEAGLLITMNKESLLIFIEEKRERGASWRSIASDLKKVSAGLEVVSTAGAPPFLRTAIKSLARLAAIEEPIEEAVGTEHPAVLAALGLVLVERARRLPIGSPAAIQLFRDGTLIYTLAFRPLRVRSLVAMRIGEELQLSGAASGKLCMPASAMKAKKRWSINLNSDVSQLLHEWISVHRRYLSQASTSSFVLISHQRSKKGGLYVQSVGDIVRHWTLTYIGKAYSPHDFRHAAGTMIMSELPEMPWIGSAMLQHSDLNTIKTYSKGHDTLKASSQFGLIVDLAHRDARAAAHAAKAGRVPDVPKR